MAGTLTISTLSDGTNSTSSTNCIQGSAKAWVNFNGTTSPATILASYNVSSVSKTATGDWTVNFTNAMSSSSFATACCAGHSGGALSTFMSVNSQTTSTVRVQNYNSGGTLYDDTNCSVTVFR